MEIGTSQNFAGKKVTVMGLGLLGGALNDVKYLAGEGAVLTITDLKTAEELKPSLVELKNYKGITYVLGKHRVEDFQTADFILQPGNVPADSIYLKEARKNNIPIFVSESLFAKYVDPQVMLVGVTGTRGKSTTTQLIYEIIKASGKRVFLGGNVRGVSTLSLLDKVKGPLNAKASGKRDIVVMEMDSWALHGMGDIKQSPHIAVFTNLMTDHQNFYKGSMEAYFADKANIYRYQQSGDYLVAGEKIAKKIKSVDKKLVGELFTPSSSIIPASWKIHLLGGHNRENIAYALTVGHLLDIPQAVIKKTVENYHGLPGRLEFIRTAHGVDYYNDTTATTPDATLAALSALESKNIVLIGGGTDKALDFSEYTKIVPKKVKALILFKGTATDKILKELGVKSPPVPNGIRHVRAGEKLEVKTNKINIPIFVVESMAAALDLARNYAQKGDTVLLSPGAASFGVFKNEFDRGEQFVTYVKKLS